jgi:hypothetical protein
MSLIRAISRSATLARAPNALSTFPTRFTSTHAFPEGQAEDRAQSLRRLYQPLIDSGVPLGIITTKAPYRWIAERRERELLEDLESDEEAYDPREKYAVYPALLAIPTVLSLVIYKIATDKQNKLFV